MKNNKRFSMTMLWNCNSKSIKSLAMLILALSIFGLNSCKKEILISSEKAINPPPPKIYKADISYAEFLEKVNANSLGFLKAKLSKANPNNKLASIADDNSLGTLAVYTDSVQKFISDIGTSYVFKMALSSKRATSFRNLTVFVDKQGKTSAFIATYTPTREWIAARKQNKQIAYKGEVAFSPISLQSINLTQALKGDEAIGSMPGKTMSAGNKTMMVSTLCYTYTYYDIVVYPCSSGQHDMSNATDCAYINHPDQGFPPTMGLAAHEVVNCYTIDLGGGGGSGGGSGSGGSGGGSSPNPPGDYDPCDGGVGPISYAAGGNGLKLAIVPPSPCDETGGGLPTLTPNAQQLENDLQNALSINPSLLIDCNLAQAFKSLASYKPPQSVLDRIQELGVSYNQGSTFKNPYFVQQIKDASGVQINLDRFEININTLPIVGGNRLTPDEFLTYIRKNLNDFVDVSIAEFIPYADTYNAVSESSRWQSNSPLGSILHLDMADDGSVIVSDFAWNYWTVTTLRTPIDGIHPVSGNRSWGWDYGTPGSYKFYVTGADRLTTTVGNLAQQITGIPFSEADKLWESYQDKVTAFVNSHSGSASVGIKVKERPNYQAIKDYFDGKITLEQLKNLKGCS